MADLKTILITESYLLKCTLSKMIPIGNILFLVEIRSIDGDTPAGIACVLRLLVSQLIFKDRLRSSGLMLS